MSLLGVKTLIEGVGKGLGIADKAITNKDQLNQLKGSIIQAEINSDSQFLKNARPSVIYTGIFVIITELFAIRLTLLGLIKATPEMIESSTAILTYFLIAWGGVVGTISVGRSFEKKNKNAILQQKEAAIKIEKMKLEAEIEIEKLQTKEEIKNNRATRRRNRRNKTKVQ